MTQHETHRLKRLRYLSGYRGCKETDLILGRFGARHLDGLSPVQLDEYEALLREDDAEIYRWYTGQMPVPERLQNNSVLKMLLAFEVHES